MEIGKHLSEPRGSVNSQWEMKKRMEIELLNLLVSFCTMLVLAVSTTIGVLQLRALRKQVRSQHEWNRREVGLQYTFERDPMLREVRNKLEDVFHLRDRKSGEISLDEILEIQKSYPNIITDLLIVLGRYEIMAVGIKHRVCDEEICKDMLRGAVIRYYRYFSQYIEDLRKKYENPHLYENFAYYARKWSMSEVETIPPTG